MTERRCLECKVDISKRHAKAIFCCQEHKDDWHNRKKAEAKAQTRAVAIVPPSAAPQDMGTDILLDILRATHRTNELLEMMLGRGMGGGVTVTEQVTRQISFNSAPAPLDTLPDIQLDMKRVTGGKSSQILNLQMLLAAKEQYIELFTLDDLQLVTGHHAFNQALIQAELARRNALSREPVTPRKKGASGKVGKVTTGKLIKGAEVTFAAPDFDDLDLL